MKNKERIINSCVDKINEFVNRFPKNKENKKCYEYLCTILLKECVIDGKHYAFDKTHECIVLEQIDDHTNHVYAVYDDKTSDIVGLSWDLSDQMMTMLEKQGVEFE